MTNAQVDERSTIKVDFISLFHFFFFYLGEILTGEANGLFCLKQIFKQWFLRDTNNYLKKMLTLHLRARDWAYEIRTQEN